MTDDDDGDVVAAAAGAVDDEEEGHCDGVAYVIRLYRDELLNADSEVP